MADAEYHRKRRRERRKKFLSLLGNKCENCGSKKNLEFDHKNPSKKEFGISRFINYTDDRVYKEVKKCRLLCKDCHKQKTHDSQDWALPESKHGTIWHYKSRSCRCDKCKKAMSEYYHNKK